MSWGGEVGVRKGDGGGGEGLLVVILDGGNSFVHAAAGGRTEPPVFTQRKECRVFFQLFHVKAASLRDSAEVWAAI